MSAAEMEAWLAEGGEEDASRGVAADPENPDPDDTGSDRAGVDDVDDGARSGIQADALAEEDSSVGSASGDARELQSGVTGDDDERSGDFGSAESGAHSLTASDEAGAAAPRRPAASGALLQLGEGAEAEEQADAEAGDMLGEGEDREEREPERRHPRHHETRMKPRALAELKHASGHGHRRHGRAVSAGLQRREVPKVVEISGATGVNAVAVNGKFVATGGEYNGKLLYAKENDPDRWLRFVTAGGLNQWRVSSTSGLKANDDHGYIYSAESDLEDPAEASGWYVWDGSSWIVEPSVQATSDAKRRRLAAAEASAPQDEGIGFFGVLSMIFWGIVYYGFLLVLVAIISCAAAWAWQRKKQGKTVLPTAESLRDKLPASALPVIAFFSNLLPRKSVAGLASFMPAPVPPARAAQPAAAAPASSAASAVPAAQ